MRCERRWRSHSALILASTLIAIFIVGSDRCGAQELCSNVSSAQIGRTFGDVDNVQRQFWGVWNIIDNFAVLTARRAAGSVFLINVTDYSAPEVVPSSVARAVINRPDGVAFTDDGRYMICGVQEPTGSLVTVNVSSPIVESLETVSTSVFASSRLYDLWIEHEREFAVVSSYGGEGLLVANVSDPTNITLITQSSNSFNSRSVVECRDYFDGAQLFCTIASYNQRQVYLYNLTDFESPPPIATTITNAQLQTDRPMGATFHPTLDIVYVYAWNSMIVQAVNVSDPTNHVVGGFATGLGNRPNRPSTPNIIGEDNRILLYISYNSFMNFFCIRDPMNPVLINSIFLDYDTSVAAPYILPGENTPIFIPKNRVNAASPDFLFVRNLTFCGDGAITEGEQCENGTCCDLATCLFEANTTLCEPAESICRLDSFCTGQNATCPPAQDGQNGQVCGSVLWSRSGRCIDVEQCIDGRCASRSSNPNRSCA